MNTKIGPIEFVNEQMRYIDIKQLNASKLFGGGEKQTME